MTKLIPEIWEMEDGTTGYFYSYQQIREREMENFINRRDNERRWSNLHNGEKTSPRLVIPEGE